MQGATVADTSSATCRHCLKPISRHNFSTGPKWTHDDSTFEGYGPCRITWAEPDVDPASLLNRIRASQGADT